MVSVLRLLRFLIPILPSLLRYQKPRLLFSVVLCSIFLWILEQQKAITVCESADKGLCHFSPDTGTGVHVFLAACSLCGAQTCTSLLLLIYVRPTSVPPLTGPVRIVSKYSVSRGNMSVDNHKA